MFKDRLYKSGSRWTLWRWARSPLLYMRRLHIVHTPWGGVILNWISRPDPHPPSARPSRKLRVIHSERVL